MVDKKKKGGLAKRYQASYESKGSSGTKTGVMNWKKVDGEVNFFSPQEGRNRINIIPYTIKTKNHPLVKRGEFEIGDKDYMMDVWVHRGVGPSEASVVCLKNTYGKPCPICEHSAMLRKQGKEDEASALKPSRRAFYNVQDMKDPGKLKIFEASHYLFEKELIDEARDDEEGGFIDFADEETGREIKFRCSKTSKGGFEFNEFKSFSFEERDENIPDELLESAISFDEIMNVPTYDEVEKILYGTDDEDDEDEKPAKKSKKAESDDEDDFDEDEETPKKSKKKSEPEDDEDDSDDEEEVPTSKKSVKKPAKKSAPELEDDEDEEDSDEDDDEEPAPKSKKSKKPESEEDDEEDSDEDDDEDEPPAKSKKKDCKGDCGKCPFGHKFGEDTDEFDDCDECDLWDKCISGK